MTDVEPILPPTDTMTQMLDLVPVILLLAIAITVASVMVGFLAERRRRKRRHDSRLPKATSVSDPAESIEVGRE